jgi:hypothetical protein
VFKDAVVVFKLLIDTNADALNVFNSVIEVTKLAVDCDEVYVLKDEVVTKLPVAAINEFTLASLDEVYALKDAVVAKLPVSIGVELTLTLNVDESPFVKVIVFPTADAVYKDKLALPKREAVAEFKLVTDVFKL